MKKILSLSLILLAMLACGPKKIIESKYDNGNPKVVKYVKKINGKEQVIKEEYFYDNNVKKMEGEYTDEKRSGKWSAWYQNGKLWSEGMYSEGLRNGPGMVYHENGKKYIESFYTNDEKTGKWRFYDTTGKVIKEVDFDQILKSKMIKDSIPSKIK
ncbi:MAG: hypothetical protein IPH88_13730 [Bacteroidales bacterium]|nr:hypothetical protein [Bacteroidales bacterium]